MAGYILAIFCNKVFMSKPQKHIKDSSFFSDVKHNETKDLYQPQQNKPAFHHCCEIPTHGEHCIPIPKSQGCSEPT